MIRVEKQTFNVYVCLKLNNMVCNLKKQLKIIKLKHIMSMDIQTK